MEENIRLSKTTSEGYIFIFLSDIGREKGASLPYLNAIEGGCLFIYNCRLYGKRRAMTVCDVFWCFLWLVDSPREADRRSRIKLSRDFKLRVVVEIIRAIKNSCVVCST
ncbi:PREDICTED: uncharacterized protein LOC108691530 [Atta colombica]|uniref:uncharacterized protein LOC108691530 n=1 Tax=Atta colombica TaxID=520822 RepID=UPI00084C418E|nr:PREDICTED: uncharacterized protein LOC108691530 [Atta colombica]